MPAGDLRLTALSARLSCRQPVQDAVIEWLVDGSQTDLKSLPAEGHLQVPYGNTRSGAGRYTVRLKVGSEQLETGFTVGGATPPPADKKGQ
jgi:hypothetical protein